MPVREPRPTSWHDAAHRTPQRVRSTVTIDSTVAVSTSGRQRCAGLERMTIGSVVSFMLPNWHEAAVIYLGSDDRRMVVNRFLPSLRESELLFILRDADTRMIFV